MDATERATEPNPLRLTPPGSLARFAGVSVSENFADDDPDVVVLDVLEPLDQGM